MSAKTILLMRHAEKPADPEDPHLSPSGAERARRLATWLPETLGTPSFIFASAPSRHSFRPIETVQPLARAIRVEVDQTIADQDYPVLVARLASDERFADALLVICWHHGHLPSIARSFGGRPGSYPDPWDEQVFNLVLRLDFAGDPAPTITPIEEDF